MNFDIFKKQNYAFFYSRKSLDKDTSLKDRTDIFFNDVRFNKLYCKNDKTKAVKYLMKRTMILDNGSSGVSMAPFSLMNAFLLTGEKSNLKNFYVLRNYF